MTLATGAGASWPGPSASAPVRFTVITAATFRTAGEVFSIFEATGRSGDVLSGVSAVEGTTDRNYAAGDWAEHRPTFKFVDELQDAVLALEGHTGGLIGGTVSGGTANRVLIVGAGPVLAQTEHLEFNDAIDTLTVGGASASQAIINTTRGTATAFLRSTTGGTEVGSTGTLRVVAAAGQAVHAIIGTTTIVNVSGSGASVTGTLDVSGQVTVSGGLVVGVEQGGYVPGSHLMQVVATGSVTPLMIAAGSGVIEIWKDTTPTAAAAAGLAVPGNAATNEFVISANGGSTWRGLARFGASGSYGFAALRYVPGTFPTLNAAELSFFVNEGTNQLVVSVKYSDGTTTKTGAVALT